MKLSKSVLEIRALPLLRVVSFSTSIENQTTDKRSYSFTPALRQTTFGASRIYVKIILRSIGGCRSPCVSDLFFILSWETFCYWVQNNKKRRQNRTLIIPTVSAISHSISQWVISFGVEKEKAHITSFGLYAKIVHAQLPLQHSRVSLARTAWGR